MQGEWIDSMTNIDDVHICGIHLQLPGYEDGPTLEIFEYKKHLDDQNPPSINNPGFTHIAFHVEDIHFYINRFIENGGSYYGKKIETLIEQVGLLKAVYLRDPEGNIVEIQSWKKNDELNK